MLVSFIVGLVISATGNTVGTVAPRYLVVDLKDQRIYAFQGTEKVMEFDVSTGRHGLDTPVGTYRIQKKKPVMTGIDGKKYRYALQIHLYDKRMKRYRRINLHEHPRVPGGKAVSSGCIRERIGEGRRIYNFASVDDEVHVVKDARDCLF